MPMSNATYEKVELLKRRIAVARGEEPADLVLEGGRVVNVFTGEVEPANVVVADGYVVAVGPEDWQAARRVDVGGGLVLPGLIDAHMHLESTLLTPTEFAKAVVPRGTTAVVADPHEIANVLGERGVQLLLDASVGLPLDLFLMAPSCVPAAPWERAGAELGPKAVARLMQHPRVLGLAEVMNFPGVLSGDEQVLLKVVAAAGRPVDGHSPGLVGRDLNAYVAAGVRSDHECTTPEEALAKARAGMLVQVRDGSSAKNLDTLLPLIREGRLGRWCLCTDDVHPDDLLETGHMDSRLRRVLSAGVDPVEAVRHVSLLPAQHYGLTERGAVAPGYRADLVVVNDWQTFRIDLVVKDGLVVAEQGRLCGEWPAPEIPEENTVHVAPLDEQAFELRLSDDNALVIQVVPDQILTRKRTLRVGRAGQPWRFDPAVDVALVACVERHRASGEVGLGLVSGFGLRSGALGSSVAHDSHNLVLVGTNPRDLLACADWLQKQGGGFVVVSDGTVLAGLPLPIAGLLSPEPAEVLAEKLRELSKAARDLGCSLPSPFGTLSFLALSVIPELRITCRGLFDAATFQFVK